MVMNVSWSADHRVIDGMAATLKLACSPCARAAPPPHLVTTHACTCWLDLQLRPWKLNRLSCFVGAYMARFSNTWISFLENPSKMLLHL